MDNNPNKPKATADVSVAVHAAPWTSLVDKRVKSYGILFGTIQQVAKQYGIHMSQENNYLKFTAPKSRLQLFVEKLHFAKMGFFEV